MGFTSSSKMKNQNGSGDGIQTSKINHPVHSEWCARLINHLQRADLSKFDTIVQQQNIIKLLSERLHEVGQGEWCAGLIRKECPRPSSDIESDGVGEETCVEESRGIIPRHISHPKLPKASKKSTSLRMGPNSPPLIWTGAESSLIPVRVEGTPEVEFHALLLNPKLVELINDVLNYDIRIKRYFKEKLEESDEMDWCYDKRQRYEEAEAAGIQYDVKGARDNDEWYFESKRVYDRLTVLIEDAYEHRESALRRLMRRVRGLIKRSTIRKREKEPQWMAELADLINNMYDRKFNFNFDKRIDDDVSSVDSREENEPVEDQRLVESDPTSKEKGNEVELSPPGTVIPRTAAQG